MKEGLKHMKLKLFLVLLILVPIPFSCEDKNECLDLYVEPYFDIQDMDFLELNIYSYTRGGILDIKPVEQDYDNMVYPCDSLMMHFAAKTLKFHSQRITKPRFGFIQEAFACNSLQSGYAGTKERVDKIYVSSNYDFDETHNKNDNLSDVIDIFTYDKNGEWISLSDFNKNSPYEAPKRFYLRMKRKPTRSMTQQFVVKYYMYAEQGEAPEYYYISTPVLHVR